MKLASVVLLALLTVPLLALFAQQQQPAPAQQEPVKIEVTAQEVVLDLIVRDRRGRLIRDLKPEEIEVFDADQPQKLRSFRLIEGTADFEKQQAVAAAERAPDPLRQLRLITLVFSQMSVDGKRFLRQATQDLIRMATEPNLYYSVYAIDQNLHLLQPFTTNYDAVKKQIEAAQTAAYVQFSERSAEAVKELQTVAAELPKLEQEMQQSRGLNAAAYVQARMAAMQLASMEASREMDRGIDARAILYSLMALVREQSRLPGRKMVLYFTEWFNVPEPELHIFRALVSAANRANVAVYTVDAKGLVTWNQETAGRSTLGGAARTSADEVSSIQRGATPSPAAMAAAAQNDDRIQSGLRSSTLSQLRELAEDTGGFSIAETNDLRAPLRRSLEEVRTYYEAVYSPNITSYDGSFRKLTVKVNRPDTVVHARSGYFALPPGKQLQSFELGLLKAAAAPAGASAIGFLATPLLFRPLGAETQVALAIDVPMKNVEFRPDPKKKGAALTHSAVLALIKDEQGQIVGRFSQEFPLQVPADKLEAFKGGSILPTFRTMLKPGKYVLETAVEDKLGQKTGSARTDFVVPPAPQGLAISNISLMRSLDPPAKNAEKDDPFAIAAGKVTPDISKIVHAGQPRVSFYFVVYTVPGAGQPSLSLAFFQNGQALGEMKAALGAADKEGKIPYIAPIPGQNFTPGQWEMKATVTQGAQVAQESIKFTVQ